VLIPRSLLGKTVCRICTHRVHAYRKSTVFTEQSSLRDCWIAMSEKVGKARLVLGLGVLSSGKGWRPLLDICWRRTEEERRYAGWPEDRIL